MLAFGASGAFAEPSVTAAPAVDRSASAYDAQRHDALIVARREGRITAAQALQQLKDWLAAPIDGAARQRVASEAIAVAEADRRDCEAGARGGWGATCG